MILVFGGTTEGRKAAEVLEEAGSPYFYSTKTGEQDLTLQHGRRIDGALDAEAMQAFCRARDIRLIVDAAHPFAARLHGSPSSATNASTPRETPAWNGSTTTGRYPATSLRSSPLQACRASPD